MNPITNKYRYYYVTDLFIIDFLKLMKIQIQVNNKLEYVFTKPQKLVHHSD